MGWDTFGDRELLATVSEMFLGNKDARSDFGYKYKAKKKNLS